MDVQADMSHKILLQRLYMTPEGVGARMQASRARGVGAKVGARDLGIVVILTKAVQGWALGLALCLEV